MYGTLVVSSDTEFLAQAKRFLKNVNDDIEVLTADTKEAATETLISQTQVDVVVCEHAPPATDAFSLFNDMNRRNDLRPFIVMTRQADGDVAIKAFECKIDDYISREQGLNFYMNLSSKIVICSEKKRLEADRALNERRMDALITLAKMRDKPFHKILNYALEESVSLTGSQMGYISTYDQNTGKVRMLAWSRGGLAECKMNDKPIDYDVEDMGVWGEPLRRQRSVVINNYAKDDRYPKKGTPMGHVPLNRLLMIPVFHNMKIVATAGVGNKVTEYTHDDEIQFILLMEDLMSIYHERMMEDESERTKASLDDVLSNAPIGIMFLDGMFNVLECNGYAKSLISPHSLCLTRGPLNTYSSEISKKILEDLEHVKGTRKAETFEHSLLYNGMPMDIKVIVNMNKDFNDTVVRYSVYIDDITQNVSSDKALRSSIEHIRVLDTVIDERFNRSVNDMECVIDCVDDASVKLAINSHIKDLRNLCRFSKECRNVGVEKPVWQTLSDIIQRAMGEQDIPEDAVVCRVKGVIILADPTFHLVISHLMQYSMKKQEGNATGCSIKCKTEDGDLIIDYSDNGAGIPRELKSSFFSGKKMKYGLGIYLAYNIARASNFDIREVGDPDIGTTVEIKRPASCYRIDWDL
jgi:CheY-like chemotaxis protein